MEPSTRVAHANRVHCARTRSCIASQGRICILLQFTQHHPLLAVGKSDVGSQTRSEVVEKKKKKEKKEKAGWIRAGDCGDSTFSTNFFLIKFFLRWKKIPEFYFSECNIFAGGIFSLSGNFLNSTHELHRQKKRTFRKISIFLEKSFEIFPRSLFVSHDFQKECLKR